jgi:hypothetical protein
MMRGRSSNEVGIDLERNDQGPNQGADV